MEKRENHLCFQGVGLNNELLAHLSVCQCWCDSVVESWQYRVCGQVDGIAGGCGDGASGFVNTFHDFDGCPQSGCCASPTHQPGRRFHGVEQHALAGACHVWKEATVRRIEFRAVRRVVRHRDRQTNAIHQTLQIPLEDPVTVIVTSTSVAQQQNPACVRPAEQAETPPEPIETVARELTRVVTEPQIQMPQVQRHILDPMRNHHPLGPRRKIVVKDLLR